MLLREAWRVIFNDVGNGKHLFFLWHGDCQLGDFTMGFSLRFPILCLLFPTSWPQAWQTPPTVHHRTPLFHLLFTSSLLTHLNTWSPSVIQVRPVLFCPRNSVFRCMPSLGGRSGQHGSSPHSVPVSINNRRQDRSPPSPSVFLGHGSRRCCVGFVLVLGIVGHVDTD